MGKTRSIGRLFSLPLSLSLSLNPDLLDKTLSLFRQPFYAVTVLERLPVVAPLPPAWESEYLDWMRSKGRALDGKQMPAELGGGGGGDGGGGGRKSAAAPAAAENEQEPDKGKWRPAARETEADRSGDVATLRRRLDRRLFLVLGGGGGGAGGGGAGARAPLEALPSAEVGPGETTRASAERALSEAVPALSPPSPGSASASASGVGAYFVGNAPAGHLRLPEGEGGKGGGGGTLFFHRAQLVAAGGDLLSAADSLFQGSGGGASKQQQQHAWLTREELAERLGGGELGELVKEML